MYYFKSYYLSHGLPLCCCLGLSLKQKCMLKKIMSPFESGIFIRFRK